MSAATPPPRWRIHRASFLSLTFVLACGGEQPVGSAKADPKLASAKSDDGAAKPTKQAEPLVPTQGSDARAAVRSAAASGPDMEGEIAPAAPLEVPVPEGAGDEKKLPVQASSLPATMPEWTGRGPFAKVKPTQGPMKFDPVKAGDGDLPHQPLEHIDADAGSPMGHTTKFGWASDNETFTHCADVAADCQVCITATVAGKQDSAQICETEAEAKRWKALAFDVGSTDWAHGDLVFAWRQTRIGEEAVALEVSAKHQDGAEPPDKRRVRFVLDVMEPGEAFPEVVSLSPNGQTLAIVAHGFSGEGSDDFQVQLVSTGWLAAEAYNALGLELLETEKFDDAATAFIRASVANPQAWKGPFNAACAYSRGGDRRVQAALTEAVRRGGEPAIKKAKRDPDLEKARKAGWFETLVAG